MIEGLGTRLQHDQFSVSFNHDTFPSPLLPLSFPSKKSCVKLSNLASANNVLLMLHVHFYSIPSCVRTHLQAHFTSWWTLHLCVRWDPQEVGVTPSPLGSPATLTTSLSLSWKTPPNTGMWWAHFNCIYLSLTDVCLICACYSSLYTQISTPLPILPTCNVNILCRNLIGDF